MISSFLLSLREGLEAALIIGIVIGMLKKLNRTQLSPVVWAGVISAVIASLLAAVTLQLFGATLEGTAEQVFEGSAMLLAAGVLTWMIFWMQRQSHTLRSELEAGVRQAASGAGKQALFSLAFLAVLREGVELALFLSAAAITAGGQATLIGGILGLVLAAVLGWMLFATTMRLDLRRFFQVSSILLLLFAAGLVAHGVHEFNEAGWIPPVVEQLWDINPVLPENSAIGLLLKALFGYNGNPSLTETLAYVLYILGILSGLRLGSGQRAVVQKV